MSFLLDAL